MDMCPMCPAWMGGGMVIGSVIGIVIIVLLVVLISRLVRREWVPLEDVAHRENRRVVRRLNSMFDL